MRTKVYPGALRTSVAAGAVVLLTLTAACSSGGGGDGRGADRSATPPGPSVRAPAAGTLEELAALAGCVPDLQTDADELRQANCATDDGRYVLVTFATERGRRAWLDEADDYGGTHLVGGRWVAAGPERTLTAVRARLGGALERAAGHGSPGTGGEHEGHGKS
ncbi:hypothetical protein [Streptomyces yaizuensis]|uniref:Lipoprotein n=1 Tax=Streptomyces yaizuensis TaxID=2989713 RepID=A0ABQ5NUI3_9ACTN|nr:hypothetical protein [Streptomyces sp. YSPA8]GLF94023.1 lipoprotein [Streptomyces sp. YSPA8]